MCKFNSTRKDVKDISENEILLIKNKEVLILELKHTNTVLQDKEKTVNTLTILFFSAIGILTWNLLNALVVLFSVTKNIEVEDINYIINNLDLFINISFVILFAAVGFFIFMICSDLNTRGKVIKRKNLILSEIKKISSAYFTLFFHPFHSQPSTFLSLKQACKIVA